MEEIKVGEYARINNDFRLIALGIGKVMRINQDTIYVKMRFELPIAFDVGNIVKHSFDIKDLVQAGDIVTYKHYKSSKFYDIALVKEYTDARTQTKYLGINGFRIKESQIEIKEILTKEQFDSENYIVGDE